MNERQGGAATSVESSPWESIYQRLGIVQREPIEAWGVCLEMLASRRHEPLRILDAGCGTGRHTVATLLALPNSTAVAYDSSVKSLEILRRVSEEANVSQRLIALHHNMDADTSFMGSSFDIVISTLVIHHGYWRQVRRRFAALVSALGPGGLILFAGLSDHDPRITTGYEVEPGTRLDTAQDDGKLPHHFISSSRLEELFAPVSVMYRSLVRQPMVTAEGTAAHWEMIARK